MSLLSKFLAWWDPLYRGATLLGIACGHETAGGEFFPMRHGGAVLYRGLEGGSIDYQTPVGAGASAGTGAIVAGVFPWVTHAEGAYIYGARAIGPGGVMETNTDVVSRVVADGDGPVGPLPSAVVGLSAAPIAGGRFRLAWRVRPGGARPAAFAIYGDAGTGTIDWDTPVTVVLATAGNSWTSSAFADSTVVKWGVRARNAGGGEEANTRSVSATANDATIEVPTVAVTETEA